MSKHKKHEMTKAEVRAPDKFQLMLEDVWAKLVKYKKVILIALVAFVAVGVGLWAFGLSRQSSAAANALAQRDAALAIGAAVGPKDAEAPAVDPGLPEPLRFADADARRTAVTAAIGEFMKSHGDDGAAELVALTDANLKLQAGQVAEAQTAVDAWLQAHAESPTRTLALELKARILQSKGEREAAVAVLDELSKSVGGSFKAEILTRLGDLQNPALNGGQGDATKAKGAYEAALASMEPAPAADADSPFGPGGLRGTLQNRIELLP